MPRVVIDTNVLISAILFGGNSAKIIEELNSRSIVAFTSHQLISELLRKLAMKFDFPKEKLIHIETQIIESINIVYPTQEIFVVRDLKDNCVLEAAVESKSEYIITGDKDLLTLKNYNSIQIVTPKEFLDLISK